MNDAPVTDPHLLHDRFMQVTNAHDAQGMVDLYEPDGVAVLLEGGQVSGPDGLRAMADGLTGAIRHIDGSTRKLLVAGDIVLSSARWTAEIVLPDGSVVVQEGVTAEVSRRQPDGSWRFVIDDPLFV